MSMYNTQQNEVEMVTAEGQDPNPTLAERVDSRTARVPSPAGHAAPPTLHPWILWYAPNIARAGPTLPSCPVLMR